MANVFTKRNKIPRTTTLGDFGYRSQALRQLNFTRNKDKEPEITRILSPTRRQNPQPIGLVYQSPYNRYSNVFGIWNPNQMMPVMRCDQTLPHLRRTNFSCQHDPDLLRRYMAPADPGAPVQRKEPEIHFSRWTIQRKSYKWPPEVPGKFRGMVKTTRFGHTPYNGPAVGIVPNVLTRISSADTKQLPRSSDKSRVSNEVPGISARPRSAKRIQKNIHDLHNIRHQTVLSNERKDSSDSWTRLPSCELTVA